MDPISLIVAAIVAGAAGGGKTVAEDAVKGAYGALKGLILRKFGSHPPVQQALERVEQEPQQAAEELRAGLAGTGAERDTELVRAAQALLAEHDPEGTAAGRYDVQIDGGVFVAGDAKGVIGANYGDVTMNF
jgi:hypothetical protein